MKVEPAKGEITCGYEVCNFRRGRSVELDLGHVWVAEVHFSTPSGAKGRIGWVVYREGRWEKGGSSIDAGGIFWSDVRDIAAQRLNELYPHGLPEEMSDSPPPPA